MGTLEHSLEDELLGKDRVLALSGMSPGHLHAVQRDDAVGVGEVFDGKFVSFFHIQD